VSGPAVAGFLLLTVTLVLGSFVLLVRAVRRNDPTSDLLALLTMIGAGIPAAVYGAASG
jgi:ABC-type dipeptide/oligopeptide/nickel transport system permease component